jgi:hypothetical protein
VLCSEFYALLVSAPKEESLPSTLPMPGLSPLRRAVRCMADLMPVASSMMTRSFIDEQCGAGELSYASVFTGSEVISHVLDEITEDWLERYSVSVKPRLRYQCEIVETKRDFLMIEFPDSCVPLFSDVATLSRHSPPCTNVLVVFICVQ